MGSPVGAVGVGVVVVAVVVVVSRSMGVGVVPGGGLSSFWRLRGGSIGRSSWGRTLAMLGKRGCLGEDGEFAVWKGE